MRAARYGPSRAARRAAADATWGAPPLEPDRAAPSQQPRLKKWVSHRSGPMLGFCSVQLASGMIIHDIRIMTGKNGLWVAMPAERQLGAAGRPRFDANGKLLFNQIIEFKDRQTADRFSATIVELVRRKHPCNLDERGSSSGTLPWP
jgi:hypothetical protein